MGLKQVTIISAWKDTTNGTESIDKTTISPETMKQIEKEHKKACSEHPTWAFFGGVLTIGDVKYQVA